MLSNLNKPLINKHLKTLVNAGMKKCEYVSNLFLIYEILAHKTYLNKTGWFKTFYQKSAINQDSQPIPWMSYPFISFIDSRLEKNMAVFEYGSGNSTLWWAEHVGNIISCEHELEWFQKMKEKAPSNVEMLHYDLVYGGDYCQAISNYYKKFDIVVIDGRDRVNCAKNSLMALKQSGVIIWDNTERQNYSEGCQYLSNHGYKRIDFTGLAPINTRLTCTSIFYKNDNCLKI